MESISSIRNKICEPLTLYNFVSISLNIIYLVELNFKNADTNDKIDFAVAVLDSIPELTEIECFHLSTIESLYTILRNKKQVLMLIDIVKIDDSCNCCRII